jgi:acyl-CoA dehydrogenase family protein 9
VSKSLGELKAAVDDIFNNFIKGFGVLTDYAEKRLTRATGVGRDKILTRLPEALREPAGIYERYTLELAKACDFLLRKHGKSIADRQHDLKRVADIGIDLFVGLRRMVNNVRRIARNEDEEMNRLAEFILDKGSYPWDVVS